MTAMRDRRTPARAECVAGLKVISGKEGFSGDKGVVVGKHGRWWMVGFGTDRGVLQEPHLRSQLFIVDEEETYGQTKFVEARDLKATA